MLIFLDGDQHESIAVLLSFISLLSQSRTSATLAMIAVIARRIKHAILVDMQRNVEHIGIGLKCLLDAVAWNIRPIQRSSRQTYRDGRPWAWSVDAMDEVTALPVKNEDPSVRLRVCIHDVFGGNGHIVKVAKAHGLIRNGMMARRADNGDGILDLPRGDGHASADRRAR